MNEDIFSEKLSTEMISKNIITKKELIDALMKGIAYGYALGICDSSNRKKKVCCIFNGVIMKIYNSETEAAKDVKGDVRLISKVCLKSDGNRKKHKGLNWKFYELFDFVGKKVKI